jgi:hypothetical protein
MKLLGYDSSGIYGALLITFCRSVPKRLSFAPCYVRTTRHTLSHASYTVGIQFILYISYHMSTTLFLHSLNNPHSMSLDRVNVYTIKDSE